MWCPPDALWRGSEASGPRNERAEDKQTRREVSTCIVCVMLLVWKMLRQDIPDVTHHAGPYCGPGVSMKILKSLSVNPN